ncbi:MAG: signal peptidase I [Clostridia bacterium]|nr:signal peptidase I [Clostridia bacterium]
MKRTKPAGADRRPNRPTASQIEDELIRVEGKRRFLHVMRSAAYVILVVAAVAVLLSQFLFPVLRVYGPGMHPTVNENEIVICIKQRHYNRGDIVALYYNNRILLRRVIGVAGDSITIEETGDVIVNDVPLDEPYVAEKSFEPVDDDILFPLEVSEGAYFVLADNRTQADSRVNTIGTVTSGDIAGKVLCSVWPLSTMRSIE